MVLEMSVVLAGIARDRNVSMAVDKITAVKAVINVSKANFDATF